MTNGSRRVIDFSGVEYTAPDPVEAEERARRDHEAYIEWMADRAERAASIMQEPVVDGEGLTRTLDFSEVADLSGEIDAADLLSLDLPPLKVLLPDILVQGTTVLLSAPKIGKSMWCYQLAVEAALDGTFLDRKVTAGQVLYMALEDGQLRGQTRLLRALQGRKMPHGRLTVRWDAPPIGSGLETVVEEWLSTHEQAVLVIVDTLGRVRPRSDGKRNAYEVDVQDLGALQRLMRDRAVVLLIVHHTRKANPLDDDFVLMSSGTNGIPGSTDHVLILTRKRVEKIASLRLTGRELPEMELALRFDEMLWTYVPELLPGASPSRQAVYTVVEEQGPIFPAAIARLLKMERTAVQHLIDRMIGDGEVAKTAGGYVSVTQIGRVASLPKTSDESDIIN